MEPENIEEEAANQRHQEEMFESGGMETITVYAIIGVELSKKEGDEDYSLPDLVKEHLQQITTDNSVFDVYCAASDFQWSSHNRVQFSDDFQIATNDAEEGTTD